MKKYGARLLIGLFAAAHCLALAAAEPRLAPKNPRFVEWDNRRIAALTNEAAASAFAATTNFGFRPSSIGLSHLAAAYRQYRSGGGTASVRRVPLRLGATALPAKWDSRDVGGTNWVTSVRDQTPYGACWAFATMACLETTLLRTGEGAFDLCENHLARHPNSGFLWGFDDGGNNGMAMAMLTRWQDPLLEEQDPYPDPRSTVEAVACRHVQNIDILPARADSTDNDELKRAVMRYGAVMTAMRWDGSGVNPQTGAHYYNGTADQNHAITLVGWDDDYPLENFPSSRRPSSNGAFLIKNSWGANHYLTTNGYNWVSYCDTRFARDIDSIAIDAVEPATNYGLIYEYDPNGMIDATGYGESGAWAANLFKSAATGVVAAVGFYALSPGTAYTVNVYTNCLTSKPDTGGLASTQSGTTTMAGYLTVRLENEVPIIELNERFSVVIHLDSPSCEYPIAIETSYPGYVVASANACESFISYDGSSWSDLTRQSYCEDANCCIKAYTKYGSDYVPRGPTNVYVQAGSASPRPDGSESDPYPTIGAALEKVIEGDVVLVGPGTYDECVEAPRERIEIRATEGPAATFIDPAASNCCYYGGANADTLLAGFTLTNGCCNIGGGACYGTISNCVIVGCYAYYDWQLFRKGYPCGFGGGAYSAILTDCVVRDNIADKEGGGLYDCLAANVVVSNGVSGYGGGVTYSILTNCLVVGNMADFGGGVCDCFLANSTVADNYAVRYGGGAYLNKGFLAVNTSFGTNVCAKGYANGNDVYGMGFYTLTNCLVDANAHYADPTQGDYRLSANSPCIDAGCNDFAAGLVMDLAGGRRLVGARVDIGCYEYDHVPAGWADPGVTADDSPATEAAKVQAALVAAGFSQETSLRVTSSAQYMALTAWAEQRGVPTAALVASPTALVSSALWADALLDLEPEDLHLVGLEPSADGWTLRLSLDDYRASQANASLLKAAVGVVGADAIGKAFDATGLTLDVTPREDHVELSVRPPAAATTYFLKTTIH